MILDKRDGGPLESSSLFISWHARHAIWKMMALSRGYYVSILSFVVFRVMERDTHAESINRPACIQGTKRRAGSFRRLTLDAAVMAMAQQAMPVKTSRIIVTMRTVKPKSVDEPKGPL